MNAARSSLLVIVIALSALSAGRQEMVIQGQGQSQRLDQFATVKKYLVSDRSTRFSSMDATLHKSYRLRRVIEIKPPEGPPKAWLEKLFDPARGWKWTKGGRCFISVLVSEGYRIERRGEIYDLTIDYIAGTIEVTTTEHLW